MNHPLLSIHLNKHPAASLILYSRSSGTHSGDFSRRLALVMSPSHQHFVVLPHGHGADVVLGSQLLRERSAHQHSSDARGSAEVALSLLSPRRRHALVQLHRCRFSCTKRKHVARELIYKRIRMYHVMLNDVNDLLKWVCLAP